MVKGASIRNEQDGIMGLKFQSTVNASWLTENNTEKYTFGTLIYPASNNQAFDSEETLENNIDVLDAVSITHIENAKITDYYCMGSEGGRILLPDYTILQQTMSSSCGVCSVNSALKYYGEYADTSYYDLELVYTNAYDNNPNFNDVVRGGTSNAYHQITFRDLGYTSQYYQSSAGAEPVFEDYYAFISFVKYYLTNGRSIVTIISPSGGHFVTIIGYDSMGTKYVYDDVLIVADSSDYWDGYQDGFNIYLATQYYRQFANGGTSSLYQCLIIDKKN